jgi:hypothetical protein
MTREGRRHATLEDATVDSVLLELATQVEEATQSVMQTGELQS